MAKEAQQRVRTVGYHREKGAQTFYLLPDEELPKGFRDTPYPGQHPNDADNKRPTAEEAEAGEKPPETTHGRGHATAHK